MTITDVTTAIALGLGLAADAVAVGAAAGVACAPLRRGEALRMALVFGIFQAVMPTLGWLVGLGVVGAWADVTRWVAAGLLTVVAWRLYQGSRSGPEPVETPAGRRIFDWLPLLATGVATSLDALAAGVAVAALGRPWPVATLSFVIIGLVTMACVWPAVRLGGRLGTAGGRIAGTIGALVLLGVAVRLAVE